MARIHIRMLGAWRIETPASGYIDVSHPIERAVLLMLATAGDRGAVEARLISSVLGSHETVLADPRRAVRRAIQRLRRKCGGHGRDLFRYEHLTGRYRLHTDTDELDYLVFLDHRRRAFATRPDDTALSAIAAHQAASLSLWTGDWNLGLPDTPAVARAVTVMNEMRTDMLDRHIRLAAGTPPVEHLPLPQIATLLATQAHWSPAVRDAWEVLLSRTHDDAVTQLIDLLVRPRTRHPGTDAVLAAVLAEAKRRS